MPRSRTRKPDAPIVQGGNSSTTSTAAHPMVGRWRIVKADAWDRDYLDMSGPAFIEFKADGCGEVRFGCVIAGFDCSYSPSTAHFEWQGSDEMEDVDGDGFAELNDDGTLSIEFCYRDGDEANFTAHKSRST